MNRFRILWKFDETFVYATESEGSHRLLENSQRSSLFDYSAGGVGVYAVP